MLTPTLTSIHDVTIDIGAMPILVRTDNARFARLLADRYGEFVTADAPHASMELEIRLEEAGVGSWESGVGARDLDSGLRTSDSGLGGSDSVDADDDLSVRLESGRWIIDRSSYHAEWDPRTGRGWVRQTANPYAIDGVLRILHSLSLAREGGFLLHAASAVRNGRAFIFAGISGTGKTTIARLAPPDVTVLTDEISYVRPNGQRTGYREQVTGNREQGTGNREQVTGYREQGIGKEESCTLSPDTRHLAPSFSAFGTPFAGEMARIGEKVQAPLAGLFLLQQGPENRIEPLSEGQAARELLRHVLFFAHDTELAGMVFQTVCDFVRCVPVRRLVFTPDARVWELIA